MYTTRHAPIILAFAALTLAACNKEQRANVDTAAGNVATATATTLSVMDIDMGRHVDAESKISDKTDDFTAKDTIYASVHTTGTANNGAVVARWTGPDGSVIDEKTNSVTTNGDARTSFFIAKPEGFAPGKYTVHILTDGKEVRTKDVTVK